TSHMTGAIFMKFGRAPTTATTFTGFSFAVRSGPVGGRGVCATPHSWRCADRFGPVGAAVGRPGRLDLAPDDAEDLVEPGVPTLRGDPLQPLPGLGGGRGRGQDFVELRQVLVPGVRD